MKELKETVEHYVEIFDQVIKGELLALEISEFLTCFPTNFCFGKSTAKLCIKIII